MDLAKYYDEIEPTGMILFGLILFIIPEPASSTMGLGLMLLGASWWFYEWQR